MDGGAEARYAAPRFRPGGSVRASIDRHRGSGGLLYAWRRRAMSGELSSTPRPVPFGPMVEATTPCFAEVRALNQRSEPVPARPPVCVDPPSDLDRAAVGRSAECRRRGAVAGAGCARARGIRHLPGPGRMLVIAIDRSNNGGGRLRLGIPIPPPMADRPIGVRFRSPPPSRLSCWRSDGGGRPCR